MKKTYTEDEIKLAFHKVFYGAGEIWFVYEGMGATPKECERGLNIWLDEFLDELRKVAGVTNHE